jgi:tRNA A37 threonylcarbamoyladenosine dehydratase
MEAAIPHPLPTAPPAPADLRYAGVARLFGLAGLARLRAAEVAVIGLGGVGSWAAEALARSGVGRLILVDLDEICVSNINRQVHALHHTVGQPKVEAMAERLRGIDPGLEVEARAAFFTEANADALLRPGLSGVIDAIDSLSHKVLLCALGVARGIPVVTAGGAAGRTDPTRVRCLDLGATHGDPLLFKLRKKLRQDHGFTRREGGPFGITAVFSDEPLRYAQPDGGVCGEKPAGASLRLDCASGLGTAAFVTGAFGLAAAGWLVRKLAAEPAAGP